MTFWLRENARPGSALAEPFRYTIESCDCSGLVARLQIGSVTGRSTAGVGEAHPARILSKRHPKGHINKQLVGLHLMSTSRGTSSFASVVIILSIDYPTLLFFGLIR
jgi:hypothetical protein